MTSEAIVKSSFLTGKCACLDDMRKPRHLPAGATGRLWLALDEQRH